MFFKCFYNDNEVLIYTNQKLSIFKLSSKNTFTQTCRDLTREKLLDAIGVLNCGVYQQNKGTARELFSMENCPMYRDSRNTECGIAEMFVFCINNVGCSQKGR